MQNGQKLTKNSMKHLQPTNKKLLLSYTAAIALLLTAAVSGILLGATELNLHTLLQVLCRADFSTPAGKILWFVRLPRVLGSALCGGALAVSGAVIQGVLANRLASPSIIGVNSGAGLAVTLCAAWGLVGGWPMSLFAFLGAFAAVMTVSLGAKKWGASRGTVILMGVAMNSLLGAVSDALAVLIPEVSIHRSDFKVGDFSAVTYPKLIPAAVVIVLSTVLLCTLASELDLLTLGDENARGLGLNTERARTLFLILAAALSGAAVSIGGLLSFVGLLVPHTVRRIATSESRHLLPLCALLGAGFVTLCDTLSRCLFAPYELPVGILLASLGAPFFLFVLLNRKGGHRHA